MSPELNPHEKKYRIISLFMKNPLNSFSLSRWEVLSDMVNVSADKVWQH